MAIYKIKNKATGTERLVCTRTKAGAINFVASDDYEAETITGSALAKALKGGMTFDDLTEDEANDPKLPLKNKDVAAKPATTAPAVPSQLKTATK